MCPKELTQPQHNSISALTSLPLVLFRCTQFAPMKLVYNPGGFASSRHSQKYESGFSGSRVQYTNSEKLNIISVVQKLMQNEQEALNFLEYIRPRLEGSHRSPDYIINMDQTPIYHAMFSGRTIDHVGIRTVNLHALKGSADSKRVTVAVCITASGRQIKSMVVFKGELREYCI